jgi:hypothetical protein
MKREKYLDLLEKTILMVDKPFEQWRTYNDQIYTSILMGKDSIYSKSHRGLNEIPLLECRLSNDYVLITSDRIISINENKKNVMEIKDIVRFGNEYENLNMTLVDGHYPKVNTISLYNKSGLNITFQIDSLYPAYFSKILIQNLIKVKYKIV